MDDWEENVRVQAFQIWERQGRTGNPFDHWHVSPVEWIFLMSRCYNSSRAAQQEKWLWHPV